MNWGSSRGGRGGRAGDRNGLVKRIVELMVELLREFAVLGQILCRLETLLSVLDHLIQVRLHQLCVGPIPGDCVRIIEESLSSGVLVSEAKALRVLNDKGLNDLEVIGTFFSKRFSCLPQSGYVVDGDLLGKRVAFVGLSEKKQLRVF